MAELTFRHAFLALQILVLLVAAQAQFNSNCNTPNGLPGTCVPIRQCQPLLNILLEPLSTESIQFLRSSQCGSGASRNNPEVCCELVRDNANSLLPDVCGTDLSTRIVGGEIADLTEFPWMVLLEYNKPNGKTTACGGVLVSSRYVLTAAHCIKGAGLPRTWSLNAVRLGEYNTLTERDCVEDGPDSEICADPALTVRIEEAIVHEGYGPTTRDQKNDVALLRLSENVRFSEYIKPICLPTQPTVSQKLWVAGWGQTEAKSESNVKLKLGISVADPTTCAQKYRTAGIHLGTSQLCAGGQKGKDSCRGDSGGPLMSSERTPDGSKKWTVVGIVSFGPSPCGMQNWPGVYTKIVDYVPWIMSKIRA